MTACLTIPSIIWVDIVNSTLHLNVFHNLCSLFVGGESVSTTLSYEIDKTNLQMQKIYIFYLPNVQCT